MRKALAVFTTVVLSGALTGCGSGERNQDSGRTEAETQQALSDSTFGSMTDAMNRAEDVVQMQQDRSRELDEALDKAEGR
jgi:hypothetical protein